jgi:DNA helicase HerA-like ATPase
LIRSKGVGVYFVTQNPGDIPDDVLGQLGNRVQHALRAFTAKDQKELKTAAETYRDNPAFDTGAAIQEVGTGEAVTSFLDRKGIPTVVERTLIRPPSSQLGPIDEKTRKIIMQASDMAGKYDTTVDRESAFELLSKRAEAAAKAAEEAEDEEERLEEKEREFKAARRYDGGRAGKSTSRRSSSSSSFGGALASVVAKELKGPTGRRIVRGILGGLFKGR